MHVDLKQVACLVLLHSAWALADGCYFPERAVKTIPSIPMQRAVLVWRDGVETLLVSSELDSEAQRLGWIIPLPAAPDEMSKVSPGAIKTLSFCVQPRIVHDLSRPARLVALVLAAEILLVLTWRFKRRRLEFVVVLLLALFVLWGVLMPSLGGAGGQGRAHAGVVVEQTARVGDYEISVIRANAQDALNSWLQANGYSELPPEGQPIVTGYINEGWVFAAVRLVRDEAGRNTPHPVRFQFPSPEPVYPMRLTALAGGEPQLELFVIGQERASSAWLRTEFCERYRRDDGELCYGLITRCHIGHAAIRTLIWDGAILTKLAGGVPASRMSEDLPLSWEPFSPHQERWFTREGAAWSALIFALVAVSTGVAGAALPVVRKGLFVGRWRAWVQRVLLPGLATVAVSSVVLYLVLPKLGRAEVRTSRHRRWWHDHQLVLSRLDHILQAEPEICALAPDQAADELLSRLHRLHVDNPFQGGTVVHEDSPGNVTVRQDAAALVVSVYDVHGRAHTKHYPVEGSTSRAP